MLCYVMLCYVMLCFMLCFMLCYLLCYVLCYVMFYVMLCFMLYFVYYVLCYVMFYVMLCCVMLCYVISLASPVTEQWIINKCLIGRGATTAVSQLQWSQSSHAPEDDAGFARKSREYLLSYRFRALDTIPESTSFLLLTTSVLAAQEMEELKSSLWLHRWGA